MNLLTSAAIASVSLFGTGGVAMIGTAATPAVRAAEPAEPVTGTVDQVDLVLASFTIKNEGGASQRFTWDEGTEFTLGGEPSTASQVLEKGAGVEVTPGENGIAKAVARTGD